MKAIILRSGGLLYEELDKPKLESNEILVEIKASALNHRDLWIKKGLYPKIHYNCILGSDACGEVKEVNNERAENWLNKSVIINPAFYWGSNPKAQSKNFQILGMPRNGTFAEYIAVPVDRLHCKPEHLNTQESAALPLAGLTAYRLLFTQGKLKPQEKVLITGIGGGVAQMVCQLAVAAGAQVYATSGSEDKLKNAKLLGISGGVSYKKNYWEQELKSLVGEMDLVIDGAGGDSVNKLLDVLSPGGRLIVFGVTLGNPQELNWRAIYGKQITIQGSTMGNDDDFINMLNFVQRHKLKPLIHSIRPLEEFEDAFKTMDASEQFGKLVLNP